MGPKKEFRTALIDALAEIGAAAVSAPMLDKLERHYRMLAQWNSKLNLTRIIKPKDAARLHYAESIFAGKFLGNARLLLDVGSGAGFPAAPLAITNPSLEVMALEPNMKKGVFLNEAKDQLALANFHVMQDRIENIDRSSFQAITSRAIENAGSVYPELITGLIRGSTLLLFCSGDLVTTLGRSAPPNVQGEAYLIPGSKDRYVATFKRRL